MVWRKPGRSHRGQRAAPVSRAGGAISCSFIYRFTPDWLNQIEILFSILQRKVLAPNDFDSLLLLDDRILGFQDRYQQNARFVEWKVTQADLAELMARLVHQQAAEYVTGRSGQST